MTLRTLIADDEQMARRRLRRLLEAIGDVEIVAEATSGEEALAALDPREVDLAVLDVRMPGLSGMDVAQLAADRGIAIVFATAHPEHAADAFDQGAVDYVRKPIDAARLALAVERARARVGARKTGRVALTVRDEVRLVRPEDISHAQIDGALVSVWVGAEVLVTELSLAKLERRLPSERFERVHRRALLNLDRVDRLRPEDSGGYTAITDAGHEVPVSRQAARALRKRLGL
ncbi:MAG: LytTR family DNA-binding domain-containing protein [Sandaracinaceae bacterium]